MAELRATYRLQLTPEFGFAAARELVPYLRDLGISHLYLSPSFQARPGSTHGYDVIDPGRLSDALGGLDGFRSLAATAGGAGMGVVLDVVPNHMCADDGNRYWADPALREQFFDVDPVSGRHRRFFDIDELAAVRIEDPEVFEAMSSFVLSLVRDGLVDGLRVDHPDGLADPRQYLQRLRDGGAERVWVEKILDPDEHLRGDWPVSGTVGYEFLNDAAALFVDPSAAEAFTALWTEVSGDARPFGAVAAEAKLEQALGPFEPEVLRLGRELEMKFGAEADAGEVSGQKFILARALASLPVYRTYLRAGETPAGEDRAAIEAAVAGGAGETMSAEIAALLLGEASGEGAARFITRFQQTTPAIMAKGVEDTAFYRYLRLLALNDVGGDPSRFGIEIERFHAASAARASTHPEGLLTTMTHDAKRSADVRARIGALSTMPERVAAETERFMALTEPFIEPELSGPDDAERYLIFQTMLGMAPCDELSRIVAYLEKALREAKRNSSWIAPNDAHERGVKAFAARLFTDGRWFEREFAELIAEVTKRGQRASLGQLALKLTSPGVPDTYQGDELDFRALVDPDNRRPVDFGLRQAHLRRLMGGGRPGEDPDLVKLHVTMRLLGLRARRPEPFAAGAGYTPLDGGPAGCAFLRDDAVLTLVELPRAGATEPRLAEAPGGRWRDVLTANVRSIDADAPFSALVGEHGFAVYERV